MIPGLGSSPGGGHGNPLQYSCLEDPHGQRSLAGYSPWGHRVRQNWVTKHICYQLFVKTDTNELTYKTNRLMDLENKLTKGERWEGRIN